MDTVAHEYEKDWQTLHVIRTSFSMAFTFFRRPRFSNRRVLAMTILSWYSYTRASS